MNIFLGFVYDSPESDSQRPQYLFDLIFVVGGSEMFYDGAHGRHLVFVRAEIDIGRDPFPDLRFRRLLPFIDDGSHPLAKYPLLNYISS
ncbi:MAG: hypothetical protein CSA23_05150 [Deltaproteobacteria bacterium]|nr:MAG: hypothetical protein CSA23_05150 [Deltaproteobacteria bacterium]